MSALRSLASFTALLGNRALAVLRGDSAAQLGFETVEYLRDRLLPDLQNTVRYAAYRRRRRQLISAARAAAGPPGGPLISVLMPVHDPRPEHLRAALDSVSGQIYPDWELCLVDDGSQRQEARDLLQEAASDSRVHLRRLDPGRGIAGASQAALEMAGGELVAMLDHDDVLEPDALLEMAQAAAANPEADLLYSDEDRLGPMGVGLLPYFKPDWSPDLLLSNMYLGHLLVLRRSLALEVGGFRAGFDGSQDHDLALRVSERARQVVHLPEVLYRWRAARGSTSLRYREKPEAADASRRAITEALQRRGEAGAEVSQSNYPGFFQVHWPLPGGIRISAALCDCPGETACRRTVAALKRSTGLPPISVLCLQPEPGCRNLPVLPGVGTRERARALAAIDADVVLLLRGGIEPEPDAPALLAAQVLRRGIGAAGGLVRERDGRVVHAGLAQGDDGRLRPLYAGRDPGPKGYFGLLLCAREVDALGPELWASRRDRFEAALDDLDSESAPIALAQSLGARLAASGERLLLEPRAAATASTKAGPRIFGSPGSPAQSACHYPRGLRTDPPDFLIRLAR